MQEHVGNYLKQLVVSQGFTIKDFATVYGTKAPYMSEIFEKEEVSTKVIRQVGVSLKINFTLTSSIDSQVFGGENEDGETIQVRTSGRPITIMPPKKKGDKTELLEQEVEFLRKEIASKDALLAAKDELIELLKK